MIKKRWISFPVLLSFALSACGTKPDSLDNLLILSTEANDSVSAGAFHEESSATTNAVEFSLHPVEISEYDGYMQNDAEIVPTLEDMAGYLKHTASSHQISILGEAELWILKVESPILLVSYPVQSSDSQGKEYWGADWNNGTVYRWSDSTLKQHQFPETVAAPNVFPTALTALDCVKNKFWNPGNFTAPFELELIPGPQDSDDEEQYPYYKSQMVSLGNGQSSTYYITVDQRVEESGYLIHSYEVVMDSPEEGHTATTSWTLVYDNGFIVDQLLNNRWIAEEAME